MISPKSVYNEAKKRENENLRFRSFLKNHADEAEVCPIVFEILERLKDLYHFRRNRR